MSNTTRQKTMSMKDEDYKVEIEQYKLALKMIIDSVQFSMSRDALSKQTEFLFNSALEYGKSVLNDTDEQTDYTLDPEEIENKQESEIINEHTSIVPEPEPEPEQTKDEFQGTLFQDEFNSCPEPEPEPEPKKSETNAEQESESKSNFSDDLPFDLPVVSELNEELKQDVQDGLLDENTADRVVELAETIESEYYNFRGGTLYVLKPEELNVEQTAPTFFANLLSQEFNQSLTEINILDMKMDYKNHIFKSLTWTNKYGVRFNLSIKKYVEFLEKYVL